MLVKAVGIEISPFPIALPRLQCYYGQWAYSGHRNTGVWDPCSWRDFLAHKKDK